MPEFNHIECKSMLNTIIEAHASQNWKWTKKKRGSWCSIYIWFPPIWWSKRQRLIIDTLTKKLNLNSPEISNGLLATLGILFPSVFWRLLLRFAPHVECWLDRFMIQFLGLCRESFVRSTIMNPLYFNYEVFANVHLPRNDNRYTSRSWCGHHLFVTAPYIFSFCFNYIYIHSFRRKRSYRSVKQFIILLGLIGRSHTICVRWC